ncbi:MAG: hypothetical protein M3Z21_04205, partial [Pseudomonadota bacterium]|nr:hypothetical protein [Pseudomonadota bacterium]
MFHDFPAAIQVQDKRAPEGKQPARKWIFWRGQYRPNIIVTGCHKKAAAVNVPDRKACPPSAVCNIQANIRKRCPDFLAALVLSQKYFLKTCTCRCFQDLGKGLQGPAAKEAGPRGDGFQERYPYAAVS